MGMLRLFTIENLKVYLKDVTTEVFLCPNLHYNSLGYPDMSSVSVNWVKEEFLICDPIEMYPTFYLNFIITWLLFHFYEHVDTTKISCRYRVK